MVSALRPPLRRQGAWSELDGNVPWQAVVDTDEFFDIDTDDAVVGAVYVPPGFIDTDDAIDTDIDTDTDAEEQQTVQVIDTDTDAEEQHTVQVLVDLDSRWHVPATVAWTIGPCWVVIRGWTLRLTSRWLAASRQVFVHKPESRNHLGARLAAWKETKGFKDIVLTPGWQLGKRPKDSEIVRRRGPAWFYSNRLEARSGMVLLEQSTEQPTAKPRSEDASSCRPSKSRRLCESQGP